MYISRVTIKNFRNFKDFDVVLKSQAIFVGANRVGKSNLLTAIQLAVDPDLPPNFRKTLSNDDFFGGVVVAEGIKISVEFSTDKDDDWIPEFITAAIPSSQKTARF